MILTRISLYYYLGLLIWACLVILRKTGIMIPLINGHLTDLYSVPMYCYTIEFVMNKILGYKWKINIKFILIAALNLSLIFEIICPLFSNKFTGDLLDIVCYFSGGLMYYFTRNHFGNTSLGDLFPRNLTGERAQFLKAFDGFIRSKASHITKKDDNDAKKLSIDEERKMSNS